jgi:phosphoserine phosphatase RsbU/P
MKLERLRQATPRNGTAGYSVMLFTAGILGVVLLGWLSLVTRPSQAAMTAWWPAAGVAVGVAILLPKHQIWLFSLAVGVALYGLNLAQFQSVPLALAASLGNALEAFLAALILRAGTHGVPALRTRADLGRLLIAVVVAATTFDVVLAATQLALGDLPTAMLFLASSGPRRAAGMLMVTPLFMRHPVTDSSRPSFDTGAQIAFALTVAALVFLTDQHLPLAFLPLLPPLWGALRISIRWLLIEMLGIAAIASYGSASNTGPFAFAHLGVGASALLQIFELTMVSTVLLLALTVARERDATAQLGASELIYRRNFENSLAGMLIVGPQGEGWRVERHNHAAALLLPELGETSAQLDELLGPGPAQAIIAAGGEVATGQHGLEIEIADGRHFQVSIAPLNLQTSDDNFSLQMLDVTDSIVARRLAQKDLDRGKEVQQALSPGHLPPRRGWDHAAVNVTAREVGGDFYDLRISGHQAVMCLGDVMGKGIGASILAASTRTALRSASITARPSDALADSVRIIEEDLARTGAFVTMGYATINLLSGKVSLVDAGHGLSFVVRAGGEIERQATFDLPIGLGTEWQEATFELTPGDALLMLSDGVLELWGTTIDELIAAIASLATTHDPANIQAFVEALCDGPPSQIDRSDDATIIMLRREEAAA